MKTIHLHIGLQKTGTSSVQAQLLREGGPLDRAGIDWLPGLVAPSWAHHNAAWDAGGHKRHQPALPGLAALVEAARASPRERLFVSSEDFSIMPPGRVRRLARVLEGFDVRPILVLRNQADFADSMFAQACKAALPGPFPAFLERMEAGGRLAFQRLVATWERAFGPGRMTLLAYEDHPDVTAAVCGTLGVAPPEEGERRHNKSYNERFVAASQRILERVAAGAIEIDGRRLGRASLDEVSRGLMAAARAHRRFAGKPVFQGRAEAQALLDRMAAGNRWLAQRVPLPEAWFQVPEDRRNPVPAVAEDEAILLRGLGATATGPGLATGA